MNSKESRKRPRILVVDDEVTITETLRLVFERRGYEVLSTGNGRCALDIASRDEPDVMLLDLVLQEMDGLALLQQMRANPRIRDIPVIIMTVVTQNSDLSDGFWQTATATEGFVTKPFDPFKLADQVDVLLAERGIAPCVN